MKLFQFSRVPLIGIPGWSTGENSFGVTKAYMHLLSQIGTIRILSARADIDTDLDLLVLPGGKDTMPYNYGQVPGYWNSDPDQFKEHFMKVNLPKYIDHGTSILGICLGFQQLAVHFGAQLLQNVPGTHEHSDEEKKGRGDLVNDIIFTPAFTVLEKRIIKETGLKKIQTCSLHHQGLHIDDVPAELEVIGHTDDGVVEFFQHHKLPIVGIQSHPEEDYCPLSLKLIDGLIRASLIKEKNDEFEPAVEGENN